MTQPPTPPRPSQPPRAPFLVRFGGTVGAAMLAALVGSSPAAFRMSAAGDVALLRAWLTLAGLAIAPMLVMIPLARLAREGLRGFLAGDGARALERVAAAMVFACTWLWFLSTFGAALRAKTHERALGGVTFAVAALGSAVFLALVARRLAAVLGSLRARRRLLGTVLAAAAMALSALALGLRAWHAAPSLSSGARATLVDGLALALSVAFFARKTFEDRRMLARIGPPAAFVMLVVSMHTLATSSAAALAMEHACPVHFALLKGFAGLAL
jgi:hypothetical protein